MGSAKTTAGLIRKAIFIAENKYGDCLVKNDYAVERFLKLAELADNLAVDQNIKAITTNIAADTEEVWFEDESWIEVYVTDLIFYEGKDHLFFKGIHNADKCGFAAKDNGVVLYMAVEGMWCQLNE